MTAKIDWREEFAQLDALSRRRALTTEESKRLEKAMRLADRMEPIEPNGPWHEWEDRTLRHLFSRGVGIAEIAKRLGRPRDVVGRRIRKLRAPSK